jgi:tRNA dimethylallyltransferase
MTRQKLVVILGPTASGKSSLAIKLAKKFKGEIISADSRQVYKGMDIGTGKVSKNQQKLVPHHLLDVTSPKRQFTAAQFKKLAAKSIKEIAKRGKLPFVVGGTAFYIYSLIDNLQLPPAKPNAKIRKGLDKKTAPELFTILNKLDPKRAKSIDRHNRVRLIRAIEINMITGKPVPLVPFPTPSKNESVLILGIKKDLATLYKLIDRRLDERLKAGMINEIKKLIKIGVSHKKLESFGLEYRYISKYLKDEMGLKSATLELKNAIHRFAKRQMTWFKRDPRIQWIDNQPEAAKLIKKFLEQKTA